MASLIICQDDFVNKTSGKWMVSSDEIISQTEIGSQMGSCEIQKYWKSL